MCQLNQWTPEELRRAETACFACGEPSTRSLNGFLFCERHTMASVNSGCNARHRLLVCAETRRQAAEELDPRSFIQQMEAVLDAHYPVIAHA